MRAILSALVMLQEVATGLTQPTDIQFFPDQPQRMVVLEKTGKMKWHDLKTSQSGVILSLKVRTPSEMGLLGVAFHPDFKKNRKIYINYNPAETRQMITRISEWELVGPQSQTPTAKNERVLLEIEQPYVNHDGGQLQFGPDGFLYIGMGDGGSGGDPEERAQDPSTLLGKMLRIDVNTRTEGKPYGIPKNNPFLNRREFKPEIWAYGLRNPWRFSFAPDGRLIAADVGQNAWEEVDVLTAGGNYGWDVLEGRHCFEPSEGCTREGSILPVLEYGRELGGSITGGYVSTGKQAPSLRGKYIFGDYLSGRIFATVPQLGSQDWKLEELGKWPYNFSTFGRDSAGDVYVAAFSEGKIFRISDRK